MRIQLAEPSDGLPSEYWDSDEVRSRAQSVSPEAAQKFFGLPDIIESWVAPYLDLSRSRVLDFGCGFGETAAGMALRKSVRFLEAIDIVADPLECLPTMRALIGIEELPDNLVVRRVSPGSTGSRDEPLDLIYSWSVFEHVRESLIPGILEDMRHALSPTGLLFLQVAPLYFSSEGSHAYGVVPERWGHLLYQHDVYVEMLRAAYPDEAAAEKMVQTYESLNRITSSRVRTFITDAGFEILSEYSTHEDFEIPPSLLEVYSEDVLRDEQYVVLARPAASS